jgi:hypothetical protein
MVKSIVVALIALFIGYVCYDYGYKTASNKQAKIYEKQLVEQEIKNQELAKKVTLIQLDKENEIKTLNSKHNAIVVSLRNRPERSDVPKETNSCTSVCAGTGSTGQQLFREDAEFLIGEAAKAEVLKQSLITCRRYLLESSL